MNFGLLAGFLVLNENTRFLSEMRLSSNTLTSHHLAQYIRQNPAMFKIGDVYIGIKP